MKIDHDQVNSYLNYLYMAVIDTDFELYMRISEKIVLSNLLENTPLQYLIFDCERYYIQARKNNSNVLSLIGFLRREKIKQLGL